MTRIIILQWIIYLVTMPLIAGLLVGAARILKSRLQRRKKGPDILQPLRDLVGLIKLKPIAEDRWYLRCAIAYTAFMALAGGVFFSGGNLCGVILLSAFGNAAYVGGFWLAEKTNAAAQKNSNASRRNRVKGENELLRAGAMVILYSMVAFGYHRVTESAIVGGSFLISDLLQAGKMPVLLLPCLLIPLALYGIAGRKKNYIDDLMINGYTGRNLAVLEIGRWYESMVYFGILFLFVFGEGVITAVLAVLVCAAVEYFKVFLMPFFSRVKNKMAVLSIGLICLLICLLNFMVIL